MPDIIITHELPDVEEPREVTMDDTPGTTLVCCGRAFCSGYVRHASCGEVLVLESADTGAGTAVFWCVNGACPDYEESFEVSAEAA